MKKDSVRTICYGVERKWESREQAKEFFKRVAVMAEGHERQRYINILVQLEKGKKVCNDLKT